MFVFVRLFVVIPAACLVSSLATAASAQSAPVAAQRTGPVDPYGKAVARLIRSIAEFSRWPEETRALRLCVATPTDHAGEVTDFSLARGRRVTVIRDSFESFRNGNCDMVYLGRYSLVQQRQMVAALQGKPVLTIAENDPACRSRSMFCLLFAADSLTFRLNLDAVSRSGIRIDPRVLRLASPGGATP